MRKSEHSVIILGSGIAGLYTAIKLANKDKKVLLITKSSLRESNSRYAQGGIACVLSDNSQDSVELHVKDTVKAGAGLSNPDVAEYISRKSADVINDLINYNVPFDRDNEDKVALTLEAAHSVRRILHAGGDSTGKSIETTLSDIVEKNPNISIYSKTQAVELLIDSDNICRGVIVYNTATNEYEAVLSQAVIIATGGAGQVYSNTTNPKIATGDGIALAYRANVLVQDMEFVQFHPTALTITEKDTRFLISESVRGEGAKLRNIHGDLFSYKYSKKGELAPRDIVTRSIFNEMKFTNSDHVMLDTSSIDSNILKERFPNIIRVCKDNGIDILCGNIPVSPAAHYIMGGIKISLDGRTSVPGLYAVGESSCVSLHGANRLASNSLLECLVIPDETVKYIYNNNFQHAQGIDNNIQAIIDKYDLPEPDTIDRLEEKISSLKEIMWKKAGIVRNERELSEALQIITDQQLEFNREFKCSSIQEYEYRNLLIIAELIVKSALSRKESRGAHYREDYPEPDSQAYHSYFKKGDSIARNVMLSNA